MSFKYNENNNTYIIEINKKEENNILIQILNESHLSEKYISDISLEYFHSLSDIFKNKSLSDIETILKNLFENKKYKLIVSSNNIKLEFNIEIPFVDTIKIHLEIPKESLFSETQLKKIISPLNKNISLLTEKIKKLEEKINILCEANQKFKNELNENINLFSGNPSKIIISEQEINFLKEIIPKSKFSLLYRATLDGDSFKTFHSKVDGKSPTIIIFITTKGKKWGAYTDNPWTSKGSCDDHKQAKYFLFSISRKKKYIRKEGITRSVCGCEKIRFCDTMGISTGSSILSINGGEEDKGNSSRYENYVEDFEITGENHFTCVETEVYKIEKIE